MVKKLKIKENISNVQDSLHFLKYKIIGNSVTIIGCDPKARHIDIPSEIDGYPVTEIDNSAFISCSNLTFVTLPNSVKWIGNSAFAYSGLTSITLPDSVTFIGSWAFYGCNNLTSIILPDSVTVIEDGTFSSCRNLISVELPHSITSIGKKAFDKCTKLEKMKISEELYNEYEYMLHKLKNCEFILT